MNLDDVIERLCLGGINTLKGKVIGLVGDLGAGKTDFVKQLLEKIDVDFAHQVSSPTYNLCHIYQTNQLIVHHFDLYRIETEDEFYEIGIFDSIESDQVFVIIEWIDMFPQLRSYCDGFVSITIVEEQRREYTISP